MKQVIAFISFFCIALLPIAQDSVFWEYTSDFESGQKIIVESDWGREVVTYLGEVSWTSPSGKELKIRIVTTYQQITEANGFKDKSVIALVKTNHTLIKTYDLVKRQNLPLRIEGNKLIYKPSREEISSTLPMKFADRFCVDGLTCFNQVTL